MQIVSPLKNKEVALRYIIGLFTALLLILTAYSFLHNKYYVAGEDEVIYYNGAKLFSETGSIRATECNTEDVSKLGQCNWYGPMYNIFYGSIARVFGMHNYNFLIINLACFLSIVLLIAYSTLNQEVKLLIICSLLALHSVITYIFTFFPETLELLFSVILSLKLVDIATETKTKNKTILTYILLILFFSLFRVSTVFWVFGLLAFSKSVKDFLLKLGVGITCFILIYAYIVYFNAPFYGTSMGHIMHDKLGLGTIKFLIQKIGSNTIALFTRNPFYELLLIPVFLITVYSLYTTKNKLMLCACIITIIYALVLLALYVPYTVFLNKQTACLFPLLLIAFFYTEKTNLKYIALILILLISPITYLKSARTIKEHKIMWAEYDKARPVVTQLEGIKNNAEGSHPITILTLYREFDDIVPFPVLSSCLPLVNNSKQPILYTYDFPIEGTHKGSFKNESNFQTYGKLNIDYILSRHPITLDSTSLAYSCNLYYLYKNNRKINSTVTKPASPRS
ncbi:MAG TPA: hypothetical protein VK783_11705 [Bacteroidia bacterium]|nr:hypothetical protein [Bacteroidia bacterium]